MENLKYSDNKLWQLNGNLGNIFLSYNDLIA